MVNVPSGWCLKHPRYRVQVQLRGQNWDFTFLAQAPTKPHFCSSTIQWLLEKVYQVYHFHSMSYHFIAFFITIHFISFHVIYIHPFLQISTLILFNSQLLQGSCGFFMRHQTLINSPSPPWVKLARQTERFWKELRGCFRHFTHEQSITRVKMLYIESSCF